MDLSDPPPPIIEVMDLPNQSPPADGAILRPFNLTIQAHPATCMCIGAAIDNLHADGGPWWRVLAHFKRETSRGSDGLLIAVRWWWNGGLPAS